ncbi:hypothetical protein [Candidatus Parabeggiatoa sp. HSG14]|uniref:hypothetical protein n=1 Tax=Candidatus Parabeggiatoa sp. HSG14 TaxID=3055593 RepID=UPI0025A709DB|nr:hypothetical protein [Thiotrichales bacterium HSG14]
MEKGFLNRWRELGHDFLDGATKPSLPALLGTLGVASTLFLLFVTLLTPDIMATKGYGYFFDSPIDDYAYLTSETLRISKTAPPHPSIILMGASNIQEAVYAKYLEKQLQEKLKQPITVYKLTAGGLFLREQICLLDKIRNRFQGIVVLQVTPTRRLAFDRGHLIENITGHSRLAMYCPKFDEEMRLAGVEPVKWKGNYFLDHYKFFMARLPALLKNIVTGPVQWSPQNAEDWRPPTKKQWERSLKTLVQWQETYHENRDANFGVYKRLVQLLRENGIEIAFLEGIRNPAAESIIFAKSSVVKIYNEYQSDVTKFAQNMKVPYWNLAKFANFKPEDFIDHIHLKRREARHRYTEILAIRIADMLSKQLKESP